jgi:hypothetical protein
MQPHAIASKGRLCWDLTLTLAFGVLLVHSVVAAAADSVQVKVSTTKIQGWACSADPQIGDAQNNSYYVCVDKETVNTTDEGNGKVTVTWTLDVTGGWTFPASQGIDIDAKSNKKNSNGNKKWTLITPCSASQCTAKNDKESGNKTYRYTVNVLNQRYLLTFDPTIMN